MALGGAGAALGGGAAAGAAAGAEDVGCEFAGGALAVCAIAAEAMMLARKIEAMLSSNCRARMTEEILALSRPISSKQKLLSISTGSA